MLHHHPAWRQTGDEGVHLLVLFVGRLAFETGVVPLDYRRGGLTGQRHRHLLVHPQSSGDGLELKTYGRGLSGQDDHRPEQDGHQRHVYPARRGSPHPEQIAENDREGPDEPDHGVGGPEMQGEPEKGHHPGVPQATGGEHVNENEADKGDPGHGQEPLVFAGDGVSHPHQGQPGDGKDRGGQEIVQRMELRPGHLGRPLEVKQ